MEYSSILKIGDKSDNGQVCIIDEDRLCYLVKSTNHGAVGVRTISKALLNEFICYLSQNPSATPQKARQALSGKSEIDKFEYGYNSTLATMAKMALEHRKSLPSQTASQIIYYGAPGTGKSKTIKRKTEEAEKEGRVFRTTFHPDSDYSTFVGCYKPSMKLTERIYSEEELAEKLKEIKESGVTYPCHKFATKYWRSLKELSPNSIKTILTTCEFTESMNVEIGKGIAIGKELLNEEEDGKIIYTFTPQAFTNAYVKAWNTEKAVYLIIEEINRGNCAQIFGDLFQLLDRKGDGLSEYPIDADTDLGNYICKELAGCDDSKFPEGVKEGKKLVLPPNLYIWATMNTSDQSLFPIDSAFKRRWDWKYIKIAEGKDKKTNTPLGWKILVDDEEQDQVRLYDWWKFLQLINIKIFDATQSADKQMGYFFAKANEKFNGEKIGTLKKEVGFTSLSPESINIDYITAETFVNKVLFYLWTDVLKDNEYEEIASLMKDGETSLSFPDFFDETGNEIAPKAVRAFLDNVMKDEEEWCEIAQCTNNSNDSQSIFHTNEPFKPNSVIFKITEDIQDKEQLYIRAKGWWVMAKERANTDKPQYVYVYSTPVRKIVACYEVEEWNPQEENGKIRYGFEGKSVDDVMIGKPVESIAHVRGQVVFYPKSREVK